MSRFLRVGAIFIFIALHVSAQTPSTPTAKVKIVYVGDSITAGYGIDAQKAYPLLVQQKLKQLSLNTETTNASVSGSLSSSAKSRVDWALKGKPHIIVLALGGNDGLKGTPAVEIEKNLRSAIKSAHDARVIVVLAGFKMFTNLGKKYTQEFQNIYLHLSKIPGVLFIPFLLESVGANPSFNLADGKHPNEQGHQKIAETATPTIQKAVQRAAKSL